MVAPFWDPVTGGGERVLKESSIALRDRGHQVDILTLKTDAERRAIWKHEEFQWNGIRVRQWPALNLIPPNNHGLNNLVRRIQGRIFPQNYVIKYVYRPGFVRQTVGYDVIQLHNDIEAGFMWLLRNSHTPRVLWCHTLDVTYRSHYKHHRFTREILRKSADLFLTGCTSTIASLRDMDVPTERIGTVHYGVHEEEFHPDPARKKWNTLLFVGGLQRHKGGVILMRALRQMRQRAHVVLLTISRNPLYGREFHAELAAERERGFHRFEHVPDMDDPARLVSYYQAAAALVTPSLESVFELVNLEAMSCGTPVVASRVGGFPDLIEDGVNGYMVPPNDPAALAERLDHVLSDARLARQLGEEGRKTILRDFTWTRVGEKLEHHYEALLEQQVSSRGSLRAS
jgi:glycosyltransferase involved in cell wall biosynthesis